ncbi:MAG: hypothetical protein MUD14_27580 [Hydrococcus sp. Prado102]|jgi:hypothetical protein|nr:hypothetical protein [Hydrococcus sp. Prado102]
MFGRSPKENKPSDPTDLLDSMMSSQLAKAEEKSKEFEVFDSVGEDIDEERSEIVSNVEKISGIVSPYFIVIVGLFLYEDNFLIGTILITIGILSLLKVSWKDILNLIETIKSLFSSQNPKI